MSVQQYQTLLKELQEQFPTVKASDEFDVKDRFILPKGAKVDEIAVTNHHGLNEPYVDLNLSVPSVLYSNQKTLREIYRKGQQKSTSSNVRIGFTLEDFEREPNIPLSRVCSLSGKRSLYLDYRPDEILETVEINDQLKNNLLEKSSRIYKNLKERKLDKVSEGLGFNEAQRKVLEIALKNQKNLPFGTASSILIQLLQEEHKKGNVKEREDYQPKGFFEKDPMFSEIEVVYATSEQDFPIIRVKSAQALSKYAKEVANTLGLNTYEVGLSAQDMKRIAKGMGFEEVSEEERHVDTFLISVPERDMSKLEKALGRKLTPSEIEYIFKPVKTKDDESKAQVVDDLRKGFRFLDKVSLPTEINYEPNKIYDLKITLFAKNVPFEELPQFGKIRHFDIRAEKRQKGQIIPVEPNKIYWNAYEEKETPWMNISLSDPKLLEVQAELLAQYGISPKITS